MALKEFFHPKSLAVVGVSENAEKLGSVVFQNILDANFKGNLIAVNPKHSGEQLYERDCIARITDKISPFDLVVVVVPSRFTTEIIDDCILNKTKNIIIISAGFSEIGNITLETEIKEKCETHNINLLGPNCLGTIFPYANLNASFSDGYPKKGNICFVSQSGAICTAILDWAAKKNIGFSHFISLGNKSGISEIEIIETLAKNKTVEIFAFYLESLKNGTKFLELLKKISPHKPVIILEPGKSEKAKIASSSHTGSLAPNFKILEKAYKNAGILQVFSMREMFSLLEILTYQKNKNFGKNLALLTNAGGVGVLTSDLSEENHLNLVELEKKTQKLLRKHLPKEANIKNPIDIIGDAKADRYEKSLEILCADKNIDQILVLLTPQRTTEIKRTAEIIAQYSKSSNKNITASFIGGQKVFSGKEILKSKKIPSFDFPVDATKVLGLLANRKQNIQEFKNPEKTIRSTKIEEFFKSAQQKKLKSLPQKEVEFIINHYGFDAPASQNFDPKDIKKAIIFANSIFPQKVVLKISSPDFLHKTDIKGVFLNIDTKEKFLSAWKNLKYSIEISGVLNAQIQIQEQIANGLEIILGVKTDPNFGKILLFGQGGIFTEIFADTTLTLLPKKKDYFKKMIQETNIGKILLGIRGQTFAYKPLIETMEKIQKLVLDFPEISAIDGNPLIITKDRAILVDFKILC
ncbi:acetate--CoA ligase family protein [Candidatus Gracilibacteria bacterium]|nr:acetate--CoA ligase family protein [Candidatus Gracilibacteria bacterium]